jgi:nucleotide-binding universal stress UspA family protein
MTDLLSNVVVPVADAADARVTADALARIEPGRVTALFVVETTGGAPDKTPVEQSEGVGEEAFEAVRERFPEAETEVRYGEDVVDAIFEAARDLEASSVAFHPRGGSRLVQLLSGDRTLALVEETDRPLVVLPGGPDA